MKIKVPYPPWRPLSLALLTCLMLLGAGNLALAQSKAELSLEFEHALAGLPPPGNLSDLPPDNRSQVQATRSLYEQGTHMDQMNGVELAQFSLRLKANTALSQQILTVLLGKNCIQKCVVKRRKCQAGCPRSGGITCKCCLHCNLQLDICVTNCLLQNQPDNVRRPAN